MSRKSIETPPSGALIWPSSEVPVPNGITGIRWRAQMRTAACTSAVSCGNTTASGGWFSIQVSVLPCCSRTAREVTSRLPKWAASSAVTASTVRGSRGCGSDFTTCAATAIGTDPFFGKFSRQERQASRIYVDFRFTGRRCAFTMTYAGSHRFRACILCAVRVLGPEGGAGLDRSEWPSQHGLLPCAVRPRHRRDVQPRRPRLGLSEGARSIRSSPPRCMSAICANCTKAIRCG